MSPETEGAGMSVDDEVEVEEAEVPKARSAVVQPSIEEVEEHFVDHAVFRAWCPHCVKGKAVSFPREVNQNKSSIPCSASTICTCRISRTLRRKRACLPMYEKTIAQACWLPKLSQVKACRHML